MVRFQALNSNKDRLQVTRDVYQRKERRVLLIFYALFALLGCALILVLPILHYVHRKDVDDVMQDAETMKNFR